MPGPFNAASGTYLGGTDTSVTLGFHPALVVIFNSSDGDSVSFKIAGSADATHNEMTTEVHAVAANGLTFTATGFTIGSDNSIAEAGKTFRYWAVRR